MTSYNPTEIRKQFIEFFLEREHTHVPSAPVVPVGDPTLMFTNAGMNQFKDVFLELGDRSYTRAVNYQKCIRVSGKHNDLEEVGPSPNHHTFFEMLGNWSFGDYYKREAIRWAWELVTEVWKIDPSRLHPTVFEGNEESPFDEEAYTAWVEETGIKADRISRHGVQDNFWEMGEVGPCGPCSELHYDLGTEFCLQKDMPEHTCEVNGDCGRYVELWNLVFIQYKRNGKGRLSKLPRQHVDTGGGFERFVRVLEGKDSNYETSLFIPIIDRLTELSGESYQAGDKGIPHRVAADHVRMLAFSLADGVLPSNEGRGYVVRRILRRAARYGREIGLETPFLYKLVEPLVAVMGDAYPELKDRYKHITGVIRSEEESFGRTLGRGLVLFGGIVEKLGKEKSDIITGEDAFKLYDTYGFPLDLTELMAHERDLTIDGKRFDELMNEQRIKARGDRRSATEVEQLPTSGPKSLFIGYDEYTVHTKVEQVRETDGGVVLSLEKTPFYAEAGGQVSDSGWIKVGDRHFDVVEVVRIGDFISHKVKDINSNIRAGDLLKAGTEIIASVDLKHRIPTQYNHTATHLLHTELRRHLGLHASQAGSLVAPNRLRFDFTHFEKIPAELLEAIERDVNRAIRADYEVKWYEKSYKEAIGDGIVALFGERYGETVRVVHIGGDEKPYSREFCGGTHVSRTGEIGLFRITSETSIAAGVRRIEALTGEAAIDYTIEEQKKLNAIRDIIGSHGSDPVEKLQKTLDEKKTLEKDNKRLLESWAKGVAADLSVKSKELTGIKIISHAFENLEIDRLKLIGDAIRTTGNRSVALLVSPSTSDSGHLCCVVTDDVIEAGRLKAGDLVGKAAQIAGGGGGGRPHMATAGTKSPDKLIDAVDGFYNIVNHLLSDD